MTPVSSRGIREGDLEEAIPGLRLEVYVRADQETAGCKLPWQNYMPSVLSETHVRNSEKQAKLLVKGTGASSFCSLFPPDVTQINRKRLRLTAPGGSRRRLPVPNAEVRLPAAELRMDSK